MQDDLYALNLPVMSGFENRPPHLSVAVLYAECERWLAIPETQRKLKPRWEVIAKRSGEPFVF